MLFERLVGPYGQIPILIRDDDTSFFTNLKMLQSIYSAAWENKFKVCLSVVPFMKGRDDGSVPPRARKTDEYYSILSNESLLGFLKEKIHHEHSVEILQHGFSHDYNCESGRWEFGDDSKSYAKMKEDVTKGVDVIRQGFDYMPKFFVPPGEDLSVRNMKILREVKLIPIYRQTVFDKFLRSTAVPHLAKKFAIRQFTDKYYSLKTKEQSRGVLFMKPVTMSFTTDAIYWSSRSINSFDSLFELTTEIIDSCIKERIPICILNHYHLYYYDWNSTITRHDLFQAWTRLLNYFESIKSSWKVSFSELYRRMQAIQSVDIARTGSKITIESKLGIHDFAFRTGHQIRPGDSLVIDEEANIVTIKELYPKNRVVLYEK